MRMKNLLSMLLLLALPATAALQTFSPASSVGTSRTPERKYSITDGHLMIAPYDHLFFNLDMNKVRTDTLFVFNNWGSSMQLEFPQLPPFLSITPYPALIPPHSEGYFLVSYNAALRNDFEMVTDRVSLLTNDTMNPVKQLSFIAVITEDFSSLTLRELRNAPVAVLNAGEYDFGTLRHGAIATYQLELSNGGKEDLIIRKIKTTCGCTAGTPDITVIPAGGKSNISVAFNTFGREGRHKHTVTLITNDPENTYLFFHIGGEVIP
jgi:hypothetical protein